MSSKDEAEKRASVSDERPVIDIDKMDIDQISTSAIQDEDAASESTLVGDLTELLKDEDEVMTDQDKKEPDTDSKENVPPPAAAPLAEEPSPLQDIPMNGEEPTITAPLTPPPEIEISTPPDRPAPPVPSRPRRNTATDINMFGRQQDVTECIGNVMFQIEAAIKPTRIDDSGEQIDLVKDYFYGRTKQTLAFPDSAETRTKEELFSHLLVNVAEGDRDMYSALDSSFDIEQVDLEGRKARRYLSISHLPPVLQIQVQRVQFDREKGTPYKSNAHLNFPETLFMDRYMDTDDPALKTRRDESWKWKEELRQLTKRKATLSKTSVSLLTLFVLPGI